MDTIRQWAVAVCATAVVCTLLHQLFPDTRLGEQGRMLLPCLFLCVLLTPISSRFQDVKLPNFTVENTLDEEKITARMRQQITTRVNGTLLAMVNQALEGYGWAAEKVEAEVDIAEDGSISMGQITLYVDEQVARRSAAVRQVAEKRLGQTVEVAIWQRADS